MNLGTALQRAPGASVVRRRSFVNSAALVNCAQLWLFSDAAVRSRTREARHSIQVVTTLLLKKVLFEIKKYLVTTYLLINIFGDNFTQRHLAPN